MDIGYSSFSIHLFEHAVRNVLNKKYLIPFSVLLGLMKSLDIADSSSEHKNRIVQLFVENEFDYLKKENNL